MMLLGLGGCSHIPASLALDVDGSTVAFKKKVPPDEPDASEAAPAADSKDDEPAR